MEVRFLIRFIFLFINNLSCSLSSTGEGSAGFGNPAGAREGPVGAGEG